MSSKIYKSSPTTQTSEPGNLVASEVDKYQATITARVLDMYNPFRIGEAYRAQIAL